MQKQLTTKQMELLILICAITEYAKNDVDYVTAIDETIADIIDEDIASNENYELLQNLGLIDDEYFATIEGFQYIKLFNEYCEVKKDEKKEEHRSFISIDIKELRFSLVSIEENPILGAISKLVPRLIKGKK